MSRTKDNPDRPSDWLTPREAAGQIKVSADVIYDACAKRLLRHVRLGHRTIRIRQAWFDDWAGSHTIEQGGGHATSTRQ